MTPSRATNVGEEQCDTRSMEKSAGWSETSDCSGAKGEVHENGAKAEEVDGAKRLGEEVGDVVGGTHVRYGNCSVLDELADPQVTSVDVLRAVVVLGVVGEVAGSLVVCGLSCP